MNNGDRNEQAKAAQECPICESLAVIFANEVQHFDYGEAPSQISLTVTVPVGHCSNCDYTFTDFRAEEIKHAAVCHYLGRLTPADVKSVRERAGLTQSQFADLTGFGEASLRRWESGSLIQSEANNKYLYLLTIPENIHRLIELSRGDVARKEEIYETTFQILKIDELLIRRAANFSLKPRAFAQAA